MKKILLVDPSAGLRDVLERVLARSDRPAADVVEVANGAEGLRRLTEEPEIGLVLSQIDLDFLEGARAQGNVPLYLIAAEGREGELSEAVSRGANGYVHEPPSADFLRLLLEETFD